MRKLLSMLTALAVVFTFSFGSVGSVFAATPDKGSDTYKAAKAAAEAEINSAKSELATAVKTAYEGLYDALIPYNQGDFAITKANQNEALTAARDASLQTIENTTAALKTELEKALDVELDTKNPQAAGDAIAPLLKKVNDGKRPTQYTYTGVGDTEKVTKDLLIGYVYKATGNELFDETKTLREAAEENETYVAVAAEKQFKDNKAKALANIKTIDVSQYSDTTIVDSVTKKDAPIEFADKKCKNHQEYARAIIAKVTDYVNGVEIDKSDDKVASLDEVKTANNALTEIQKNQNDNKNIYDYGSLVKQIGDSDKYMLNNDDALTAVDGKYAADGAKAKLPVVPLTKEVEALQNEQGATSAAELKATLSKTISDEKLNVAKENKLNADQKEAFNRLADAYKEAAEYLIDEKVITATSNNDVIANFPRYKEVAATATEKATIKEDTTFYMNNVAELNKTVALAGTLAVELDSYGNLKYDAKAIEKIVKEEKLKAYINAKDNAKYEVATAEAFKGAILTYLDEFAKEAAKAQIEKAESDLAEGEEYYDLELKAYEAAFDTVLAKIADAKTNADLKDVGVVDGKFKVEQIGDKAIKATFDAIKDKKAVKETFTKDATLKAAFEGVADKLKADAKILAKTKTGYKESDFNEYTKNNDKWTEIFAKNGVRTAADATAFYAEAYKILDAVQTEAEIQVANTKDAAEVVALIKAIPATVTYADKAAVKAAYDANKAYEDKKNPRDLVTNESTLEAAVKAVQKAESAEIDKLYDAVKSLTATTVAIKDKDALKAVKEAIKAYEEEKMYGTATYTASRTTAVNSLLTKVRDLEKADIEKAAKALPETITAADEDEVKALRAAVDAYVAEYNDPLNNVNARGQLEAVFNKLTAAEAALSVITLDALKNDIVDLGNIKITTGNYAEVEKQIAAIELAIAALPETEQAKISDSLKKTIEIAKAEAKAAKTKAVSIKKAKATKPSYFAAKSKGLKKSVKITVKVTTANKANKTGFKVYRATKKAGKYTLVKTIKTTKNTATFTNKNLKKGKTYYYKVRTYKVVDGKTYYGKYTKVKAVKAR